MTRFENLERARKALVRRKRRAVEEAIHALAREGHPITFVAVAKRAGVSRGYLYRKFCPEIRSERSSGQDHQRLIEGKVVPLRTMDEYRHVEAVLRNKLGRMEEENKKLRADLRSATTALEHERGKVEYWRQQYDTALVAPRARK